MKKSFEVVDKPLENLVVSSRRAARLPFPNSVVQQNTSRRTLAESDQSLQSQWCQEDTFTDHRYSEPASLATTSRVSMVSPTRQCHCTLGNLGFVLLLSALGTQALGVLHQRSPVAATCKRSMADGATRLLSDGGEVTATGERVA